LSLSHHWIDIARLLWALYALSPLAGTPGALVTAAAALQVVVWTITPAIINSAPALDVIEGYMWGREWVLPTYKHPAMPSWVLEASRLLSGGAIGWPAYLASQLFIARLWRWCSCSGAT
jgi:hypothetical protein